MNPFFWFSPFKLQLEKLLRYAQEENCKTDDLALFDGCALFVCNKWDLIQPYEQKDVKEAQIAKLSKKLPNLDPEKQMVYLSCTAAQTCQRYGYITGDLDSLIAGIGNLLVSTMQNKLEMNYRYVARSGKKTDLAICLKISHLILTLVSTCEHVRDT